MLKKIGCFMQSFKLDEIKDALIESGVEGITVSDVKGQCLGYKEADTIGPKDLFSIPCDVPIPSALENQVTKDNATKVKAKNIAKGANGTVATKSNNISDMNAIEAIKPGKKYLPVVYSDGSNPEARENMPFTSVVAGYSIGASIVVLLHSIAHAISGISGTVHGLVIVSISGSWLFQKSLLDNIW